jgi:hypothetical protein
MRNWVLRDTSIASLAALPDPSPAGESGAYAVQQVLQRLGSLAASCGQAGYLFDECAGGAAAVTAVESPDLKDEPHW